MIRQELHRYAQMAALAYQPWNVVERELSALGYAVHRFVDVDGVQAFAAKDVRVNRTLLSFAGSNELIDWIRNARFLTSPAAAIERCYGPRGKADIYDGDAKIRVHRGFRAALTVSRNHLNAAVRGLLGNGTRIDVVGHSAGAAVAALYAFSSLKAIRSAVANVVLFGCPRIFNRVGAQEYERRLGAKTTRVVNGNDAVCRMPPSLAGYRHVGRQLYVDWRGRIVSEAGPLKRAWNQLAGRASAWLLHGVKYDGAFSHFMDSGPRSYVSRIAEGL